MISPEGRAGPEGHELRRMDSTLAKVLASEREAFRILEQIIRRRSGLFPEILPESATPCRGEEGKVISACGRHALWADATMKVIEYREEMLTDIPDGSCCNEARKRAGGKMWEAKLAVDQFFHEVERLALATLDLKKVKRVKQLQRRSRKKAKRQGQRACTGEPAGGMQASAQRTDEGQAGDHCRVLPYVKAETNQVANKAIVTMVMTAKGAGRAKK